MRHLIDNLIEQISDGVLANRQFLFGVLLIGLLFALVHLITMLVTRWGDQKATTKALLFSIVAHLSCGSGLAVVALSRPAPADEKQEPVEKKKKDEPIKLVEVRFDGSETFETDKSGNTPLFEEVARPDQVAMTRREELPFDPKPFLTLDRQKEPLKKLDIDEPRLPSDPKRPVVIPTPETGGERAPMHQAAIPKRIFDETARRRDEAQNPSPLNERVKLERPAETDDEVIREFNRGTADRREPADKLPASLNLDNPETKVASLFNRGKRTPLLGPRRAPHRPIVDDDDRGLAGRRKTQGTDGANSDRIARLRTRPIGGVPDGGVARALPRRLAGQPRPTNPRLAMRRAPSLDNIRAGLRPNVVRSNTQLPVRRSTNLPATYRLRSLANRKAAAEKHGGTDASELAVERALKWLAANQHPDGYWDSDRHGAGKIGIDDQGVNRKFAGKKADTGITALALLSFLGAGYTHEEGPYAKTVERALRWLIAQQDAKGSLGGDASHYARMYCHGMATYALAEAYSMQNDRTVDTRLRRPLERAVRYILDQQSTTDGGWRYLKGQKSDMSMFGWQLMALKSAEIAGIRIPRQLDALNGQVSQGPQLRTQQGPRRLPEAVPSVGDDDRRSSVLQADLLHSARAPLEQGSRRLHDGPPAETVEAQPLLLVLRHPRHVPVRRPRVEEMELIGPRSTGRDPDQEREGHGQLGPARPLGALRRGESFQRRCRRSASRSITAFCRSTR